MHTEVLTLDQLLADPLIRQVMQSDRLDEADIRRVMCRAKRRAKADRPALH